MHGVTRHITSERCLKTTAFQRTYPAQPLGDSPLLPFHSHSFPSPFYAPFPLRQEVAAKFTYKRSGECYMSFPVGSAAEQKVYFGDKEMCPVATILVLFGEPKCSSEVSEPKWESVQSTSDGTYIY